MRSDKVKQLLGQVYEIINTLHPSKNSALDRAVTYALNQKEKLYLFLTHPEIEMTNNLAERTVKPYVINHKNFLFSDTEKGADASAAVMSIIETAKRNDLDVYGYLLYLLTVLPEMGTDPTEDQIKSVMTWSFSHSTPLKISICMRKSMLSRHQNYSTGAAKSQTEYDDKHQGGMQFKRKKRNFGVSVFF